MLKVNQIPIILWKFYLELKMSYKSTADLTVPNYKLKLNHQKSVKDSNAVKSYSVQWKQCTFQRMNYKCN